MEGSFKNIPEEKKVQMAELFMDDILSASRCRMASAEEAALLSGRLEVIKTVLSLRKKINYWRDLVRKRLKLKEDSIIEKKKIIIFQMRCTG